MSAKKTGLGRGLDALLGDVTLAPNPDTAATGNDSDSELRQNPDRLAAQGYLSAA